MGSKTRDKTAAGDFLKFPDINQGSRLTLSPLNSKQRRHSSNSNYSRSKRSRSLRKRTRARGSEGSDPRSPSQSPVRNVSSSPGSAQWNEFSRSLRGDIVSMIDVSSLGFMYEAVFQPGPSN